MAPANEWSKVSGLAVWPVNHLVGILNLEDPTPETTSTMKPNY